MNILTEITSWLLFLTLYGTAFATARACYLRLPLPSPIALMVVIPVGLATTVAVAWLLRLVSPRLKAGTYDKDHAMQRTWGMHFLLGRNLFFGPVAHLIQYQPVFRWLAWKALGAQVAFDSMMSSDVIFPDFPLVTVGSKALLGSGTRLSTHSIKDGKLVLGTIDVGPGALLAAECVIGPNTVIGAGTTMLYDVAIAGDCAIGKDVFIGKMVRIGTGCTIGDGAVIETDSRLPNGTTIPPGGRWANAPEERAIGHLVVSSTQRDPEGAEPAE